MLMKIYQIYVPELATYLKYKVLDPEDIESLIENIDTKSPKDFKLAVLEHVIYNIHSDIKESLRMMSKQAAERCIDAMYNGCVMLNPGIDIDLWLELAYAKGALERELQDISMIDAEITKKFKDSLLKKDRLNNSKTKVKKLSRQKFLGLEEYLGSNVIRTTRSCYISCLCSKKISGRT